MTSRMSVSGEQHTQKGESETKRKGSDSPEHSCVSVNSYWSMDHPIHFRPETKRKGSDSPEHSCVSVKSYWSMDHPIHFRPVTKHKRSDSPEHSWVSMKSYWSMDHPLGFRPETQRKGSDSPEHSCVSVKSYWSMDHPIHFRPETKRKGSDSPEHSCVSVKSYWSMDHPIHFRPVTKHKRSDSPEHSWVSMKSYWSMDHPLGFRPETQRKGSDSPEHSCVSVKSYWSMDHPIHFRPVTKHKRSDSPEHSWVSMKSYWSMDHPLGFRPELKGNVTDIYREQRKSRPVQTKMVSINQQNLKHKLLEKCKKINEGLPDHGSSILLNEIYTELYITEGRSGDVNNEHEVRQIETASRRPATQETPIKCNDLFKDKSIRRVLTKGVAGIGKTVSVQKFILDWAEERANQDVRFIFPLPFRELNLIKERKFSLMDLLHHFFPETKQLQLIKCDAYKVIFIFDGLDEYRLPLDFQNNESLSDITESTSVDVLLTNLIKGNLLPSALLWITSRPAAANQIPPECVDLVTEVRGFSDPQKEEYFRKRISDQVLANKIISHMNSSRSLYIMCHIPVFCWVAATVLESMLGEAESGEIPKTLTQMFTHFLIFHIKHKNRKYHGKTDVDPHQTRNIVLALGKLAFQQLEKGNLIFYEEDLRDRGIDVKEVSVYSGVCTQIFREESGLHLGKVFSFVHLSVQEFLAALYAFLSFISNNTNVLEHQTTADLHYIKRSTMSDFLTNTVDKALQSENGHLDLFLRFLLGLSLESNQTLLRGLLTQTGSSSHSTEETVKYIKKKIKKNLSPEKTINLFHCLNELKDHSLVQEVQKYLNRGGDRRLRGVSLSSAQWSALMFVLLNSEEKLDEFDLGKYHPSEKCLLRLLPVVTASRKADLSECSITEEGCAALCSALRSNPSSHLRELKLNKNKPGDSGVKQLSGLLEDPHCTLEKLDLSDCSIREEGCAALCSALRSNPSSHLRELKLNLNKPGDSGVKQLSSLLEDPHCTLEKLDLSDCSIREEGCAALCSALRSNPSSHLRELNLNYNKPGDSGVKQLSALLEDPHCTLEKLHLSSCSIREEGCAALCSALRSNPSSHLRELNLNYNKPGDSGVKQLSALLEDPHCTLEKLHLSSCSIREEGCAALCSALRSNPSSHLRELNLNNNKPGDSGVKQLSALLKDPHCTLEKLDLFECSIREEGCAALCSALRSNPSSHLRELNLNYNKPGDSGVKQLSALLEDPHCTLEKLDLSECSITEEGCAALCSALRSNPSSHLRELKLNYNEPRDSGVKHLSALLEDPHCTLEKLDVSWCWIREEGCAALCSALRSNPSSHLRELNLNKNEPGDSGVKQLSALLKDRHCTLEKLDLSECSIREEGCAALCSAVRSNPSSHLRVLNLNKNKPGDSGVKQLSALLKYPHCTLEKLELSSCSIGEEGCAALCSALRSNPSSQLRKLNLHYNEPGDSGVKQLSALLEDPHCTLEKLDLSSCSIREEGCAALCSALRSNPSSHLRELNLDYNEPGDSGVKQLSALLEDPHCTLEILDISLCL
ncbi:NACHT, LRR and PYD domains-containing protein 3-like isoform X5 [Brachyhypopomus gauderio]|uniref:NACHT, LRR and PYD domains-containing protein 3-like isoform X5 n=1 Tax=Brachyhypopomus gauderio TaxID=698409 RepID=UPI004041FF53